MRRWWVWVLFLLYAAILPAAPIAIVSISPDVRAYLTPEYEIEVVATPHPGDAWSRLARRLTGDGTRWEALAAFNGGKQELLAGQSVRLPFSLLRPDLQRQIVIALFPADRSTPDGWKHVVSGGRGVEGESLWRIAEWFTGDGAHYTDIRKLNPGQGLSTRKGDAILIPRQLLSAGFGVDMEGQNASKAATEVRKAVDDPVERAAADEAPAESPVETRSLGQPSLIYERNAPEPYAVYELNKGEALYSSVAIRFTGRVYAKDVGEVVDRIVAFNGIGDVSRLPVGYGVKIPLELLLPEYRPSDDATRLEQEATQRESARLVKRTRARDLAGVHVILDAGHGGRDAGTTQGSVWESTYVYDVMCRVKRFLEKKTAASVSVTTRSSSAGYDASDDDFVANRTDHFVLTNPRYELEDPVVGVNLRWYLANSIFHRAIKAGLTKEKVVFLSIHADSLHPSLRGAMAYVPGERFVRGAYRKAGDVYLARAEVRERPVVEHSEEDALMAEGLSRELARSIIGAFDNAGLQVHPFQPIRDNVVRGGREWVPAIIRYNVVPTRLLLEVCNLGNARDRELMKTRRYRQQLAEAIARGISAFYDESGRSTQVVAARPVE